VKASYKPKVAIIDYGMGNLFSVTLACRNVGLEPYVTHDPTELAASDAAILPGVGAFGDAIDSLKRRGLVDAIDTFISGRKPFMGICLGMQLLFSRSEEFGRHDGLGIIPGCVVKFPAIGQDRRKIRVPHVGWSRICIPTQAGAKDWADTPLNFVGDGQYMYFVHSYYVVPELKDDILSVSEYDGVQYCSSIYRDNIFACQFHPERSADGGIEIYRGWAESIRNKETYSWGR
jgi:glutamine amidotransferase